MICDMKWYYLGLQKHILWNPYTRQNSPIRFFKILLQKWMKRIQYLLDVLLDDSLSVLLLGIPAPADRQRKPKRILGYFGEDTSEWGAKIEKCINDNIAQENVCDIIVTQMESETKYRWLCFRISSETKCATARLSTLAIFPFEHMHSVKQWTFIALCTYEKMWINRSFVHPTLFW